MATARPPAGDWCPSPVTRLRPPTPATSPTLAWASSPRRPRPGPAAQPGRSPPYLVVVVGVPLLQEGGSRRLVLLLELRADGRPPALRLLRRRGRRGLLLR